MSRPYTHCSCVRLFCKLNYAVLTIPRKYRYTAYKEFVWWIWGRLGRFRRVRLPCCVVARIREEFPSATYTGFHYS